MPAFVVLGLRLSRRRGTKHAPLSSGLTPAASRDVKGLSMGHPFRRVCGRMVLHHVGDCR